MKTALQKQYFAAILGGFLPLLLSLPVHAHNGALALAVPISGITIDGDLSDWPDDFEQYPIACSASGFAPRDAADFQGSFRIGYNAEENALYVAVEVRDESLVLALSETGSPWNQQDGCDLYVDVAHEERDSPAVQYAIWGDDHSVFNGAGGRGDLEDFDAKVSRTDSVYYYEWRVDIGGMSGARLHPGMTLGIDLFVWDRDEDGSFSWMSWGRGGGKVNMTENRGDVILVDTDGKTDSIRGRAIWREDGKGISYTRVRLQSRSPDAPWVRVETGREGYFAAELPAGSYLASVEIGRQQRQTVAFEVPANDDTLILLEIDTPRNPGILTAAGSGKVIKAGPGIRRGPWHNYGPPDGLRSPFVMNILEDPRGDLWFNVSRELIRFDGYQFTSFPLPIDPVHTPLGSMIQDRQGHIWIGAADPLGGENGLVCFDGRQFVTFTVEDGLPHNRVYTVIEDRQGYIWCGTENGLARFDGRRWRSDPADPADLRFTNFNTGDGLPHPMVLDILEDRRGDLWIGTADGVVRYDGQRFIPFPIETGAMPENGTISAIFEDSRGNLWFGTAGLEQTRGFGIVRYDGRRFTTFDTEDGLPDNRVLSFFEDREGGLWIGTPSGLSRFDGQQFTSYTKDGGLIQNTVNAIAEDREGNIWFGTAGGLSNYGGQPFDIFTAEDGLPPHRIVFIYRDSEDHLWLGTMGGGLVHYDGKQFTTFTTDDGLPRNNVISALEDSRGDFWFGTDWGGVSRYDGKQFTTFTAEDGLPNNTVASILEDRAGHLWFGVQGISRYDGERFTHFTTDDRLGNSEITCSVEDREGNLWFGSYDGLFRYDGEEFTTFTTDDGLASNVISCMLEDSRGNLWFGGDGLVRYEDGQFTTVAMEDELPHHYVRSIFEDRDGVLWISTNFGVSRYDGLVFQNLLDRDGLANNSVWAVSQDSSGAIWLSNWNKLVRYRPSTVVPPVRITNAVTNREHGPVAELHLPTSQNYLALEFQGRSFRTRPGQMVYVYRLKGFEEEWRQTRENRVEYGGLPRGEYLFEVKAVDRDLNYSEPATVAVHVHLPYERFAWMSALSIALLLIAWQTGRVVRRDRRLHQANSALSDANNQLFQVNTELKRTNEQLESANREIQETNRQLEVANAEIQEATRRKSDFLARMSHDLRTPMNAIIGYTRILLRRLKDQIEPRQLRNLQNIDTSSHSLLNLINEILDLSRVEAGRIEVHPQNVDLRQLAGECAASVEPLVGPRVEFRRQFSDVPSIRTDPEILRKVLMNLLGNAVKFTDAGSITLSVQSVDGAVELSVADTGVGIPAEDLPYIFEEFRQVERQGDPEKEGTGLGLAIAKKSVELLGGTITAESEVGEGTVFTMRISNLEDSSLKS